MKRRDFVAMLAALPFVRRFASEAPAPIRVRVVDEPMYVHSGIVTSGYVQTFDLRHQRAVRCVVTTSSDASVSVYYLDGRA